MFFTGDGRPAYLNGLYAGRSAFLIAGGPSFADDKAFPKEPLQAPGVITMAVNNAPKVLRPTLWTSVDVPEHFIRSIWLDPRIMKFCAYAHIDKHLLDNDSAVRNGTLYTPKETWVTLPDTPKTCPNTFFYARDGRFDAETFLTSSLFNWGNDGKTGRRSVLLVALRQLIVLGITRIFLLGVDFNMTATNTYSFDQGRLDPSVRKNNLTYKALQNWFTALRPKLEAAGVRVFNCNPESRLTAFDHLPYHEALALVQAEEMHDIDYAQENTRGLYDRKGRKEHGGGYTP